MDKTVIWDRTPPQLYINCSVYVWGRAQGSQIFKRNSIISIRCILGCSKVMAFLVILVFLWSLHGPRHPCIIPTSSPHHPHHPHVIPIAPRRSPCGPRCPHCPHPCCPRRPHVILTSSLSSPCHLEGPQIIPNPPDSHPTHPPGGGGPQITKNA